MIVTLCSSSSVDVCIILTGGGTEAMIHQKEVQLQINNGRPSRKRKVFIAIIIGMICGAGLYPWYLFILNDELNQASEKGDLNAAHRLLNAGANVNGRNLHYMTPLMSAAKGGHIDVATYLISKGADVDGHNGSGSVLMWAAFNGNAALIRLLLKQGADVNWTSKGGGTALNTAETYGHPEVVRILKQARAKQPASKAAPTVADAKANDDP